jgi:hypothetical protein
MPDELTSIHATYVGWVMAQLQHRGFLVRLDGGIKNRLHVMPTVLDPGEVDLCFEVEVPEPHHSWERHDK